MRNNIKKIGVSLVLIIFLASIIYAEEQGLGGTPQDKCVSIKQSYANSTFQNITSVTLPDKLTIIILNAEMENIGQGLFNYTFCNTSQIGQYIVDGIGDVDGKTQTWVYDFYVSPLGLVQSTSQGLGSAIFLFLMVALMLVFGYVGLKLFSNENWWVLGLFFEFFAIILLVYNTYLGYEYHRLFTGLPDSAMPETIFWMLFIVIIGGVLVSLTLLILNWKKVFKYVKKEIKRKETEDKAVEDWDVDEWGGEHWGPNK